MLKTPLGRLRAIGMTEGVSFLLLLGIAMPLKYAWGLPMAVKVFGWIHGALFMLFCVVLAGVWSDLRWPVKRVAITFVAALLPFGPFVIDRRLREEDRERGGDEASGPAPP